MSHTDLYRSGRISRSQYETAERLKQTGQKKEYKRYEKFLKSKENQAGGYHNIDLPEHVSRAERTE